MTRYNQSVRSILLALSIFLASASTVHAEVLFEGNFDDGNSDGWTVVRNRQWANASKPCMNGVGPAFWQVQDGRLGITIDGPPCITEIIPTGLDLSSQPGFVYEFDWLFRDGTRMDRNVIFLWQDPLNWYGFQITNNRIVLQKVVAGSVHQLANSATTYPFITNGIYHFKISVKQRQLITLSINDEVVLDMTEQEPFIAGPVTVGLQASVGNLNYSASYFDNLVVTTLEEEQTATLPVPALKQTDPLWKDQTYDSAQRWSATPTIGRWGCALTSMAMILQYYQFTHLPDGTPLTPASLNDWLKNQRDGYIGEGLVNWLAVTRLTRLLHKQNSTLPTLEYQRVAGTSLEAAATHLNQAQPVIAQIPGHFVVGHGLTDDQADLAILDPFYDHQRLSDHQLPLLSTRLFQPSHTDLSYILVVTEPNLFVRIVDDQHQPIDRVQSYSEYLFDPENQTSSPVKLITQLDLPDTSTYHVEVINPSPYEPAPVKIFTYNQEGELSEMETALISGSQPQEFTIDFSKNQDSTTTKSASFELLREELPTLYAERHLAKSYAVRAFDRILRFAAATTTPADQRRYLKLLRLYLQHYSYAFSDTGRQFFIQELDSIEQSLGP